MTRYTSKRGSLLLLGLLLASALLSVSLSEQPVAAADEYDTLRDKWKTALTGGSVNTADADIAARISALNSIAQTHWDNLNTASGRSYLWSDLSSTSDSYHITQSYDRLRAMAVAYATSGAALAGNTTLKNNIVSALDWLNTNRYYARTQYDNWWDWEIGSPLRLNDIVVLMYDDLTSTQRTNYMNTVNYFTPVTEDTGANRVWKATVVGVRGIIVKDSAKLVNARDGLSAVFNYVTSDDGFYTDGSFIQHHKHPYTGGYGISLLLNLADFMYLLNGSTWTVTDTDRQNVYQWVYDSYEPIIYKGATMDMVRGREISRYANQDHVSGHTLIGAIARVSQFAPSTDALNFKRMIKYWVGADTYRNFYQDVSVSKIAATKAIMADSSVTARAELVKHQRFPNMDRVVHLRPGWGFGLSMSSSRIYNYERWLKGGQSENHRAWYAGDGMTYLYNADLGQYSEEFWATVNPYRLPGTTVDTQTRSNGSGAEYLSIYNWVGGVSSQGLYGVSAMALDGWNSNLSARKAWFMFDDEVVALGAGITNSGQTGNGWDGAPRRVETIIENRRISSTNGGTNGFLVNGTAKSTTLQWSETMTGVNWAHLQGNGTGDGPDIGYYFPGGATVKALRDGRSGKWTDVNTAFPLSTVFNRNYMTLWFDHGTNPTNATYSYVLLPGQSSSAVSSYASSPETTILANDANVQAVRENGLGLVGAAFWTDTSQTVNVSGQPYLTSNKKAAVMVRETATEFEIAISDPTQVNTGTIQLEIHRSATSTISVSSGVTVSQLGPTIQLSVSVSGAKGKSFVVRLGK